MTALIIMMIATYNGIHVPALAWVVWAVYLTLAVAVSVLKEAMK